MSFTSRRGSLSSDIPRCTASCNHMTETWAANAACAVGLRCLLIIVLLVIFMPGQQGHDLSTRYSVLILELTSENILITVIIPQHYSYSKGNYMIRWLHDHNKLSDHAVTDNQECCLHCWCGYCLLYWQIWAQIVKVSFHYIFILFHYLFYYR